MSISRQALIVGVSAIAIGVAAPAAAAPTATDTTAGISQITTQIDVNSVLTISNIDEEFDFGVVSIGDGSAGPVSASVNSVVTGRVEQIGNGTGVGTDLGDAELALNNNGDVSIGASALASGTGYAQIAYADVYGGLGQQGLAVSDAALALNNNGNLSISADATAAATGYAAEARASVAGLYQSANGETASVDLTNAVDQSLSVKATAGAVVTDGSSDNAYAYAYGEDGINQAAYASDGNAGASLTNDGTIEIANSADAKFIVSDSQSAAGYVGAYADGEDGIVQSVNANSGDATARLTNAGTLEITTSANAEYSVGASASAYGYAYAGAEGEGAIVQVANAGTGNALASLTNEGTLDIATSATAKYTVGDTASATNDYARANAFGAYGVVQVANASTGNAEASLTNEGTLTIATSATAEYSLGASASADGSAYANAFGVYGIDQNAYAATGDATASLTNEGTLDIATSANAKYSVGTSGSATDNAIANADGRYGIDQNATAGTGAATAELTNKGTLTITTSANADYTADALADAAGNAYAYASGEDGIFQSARSNDGVASALIKNEKTLSFSVTADAAGVENAKASANADSAISQSAYAYAGGTASAELTNTGSMNLAVEATASGSTASAIAYNSSAIYQYAGTYGSTEEGGSGNASVKLNNTSAGTLTIASTGTATSNSGDVDGFAEVEGAVVQYADSNYGNASASLINDGKLYISSTAKGVAAGETSADASVNAYVITGIDQSANAYGDATASVELTNNGTLDIAATADATAVTVAYADGDLRIGVTQSAYSAGGDAISSVSNTSTGVMNLAANGTASGDSATARAGAQGVYQEANAGQTALVKFNNAGTFNLVADAKANGAVNGDAIAEALGVSQAAYGSDAAYSFVNSKTFTVQAIANAAGTEIGNAEARAGGYIVEQSSVNATVDNSGTMTVSAKAVGTTNAGAGAIGINLGAYTTTTGYTGGTSGPGTSPTTSGLATTYGGDLTGTITNSGTLNVTAQVAAASNESANAAGIRMASAVNTATLTNTGTIKVSAQTTGGEANAVGILVEGDTPLMRPKSLVPTAQPLAIDVLTINNTGGTIIARNSVDGGATWTHGLAIDTSVAPNPVEINLMGSGTKVGTIYGDIDISALDVINVSSGETQFDGKINPNDDVLEGELNILSGGTLYLQDEPTGNTSYDGPAAVNVDNLTIAAGGKLALQLPSGPSGSTSYPTIVANTADITGATLEVRLSSSNGLYGNSYSYDNVIDAETLTGKFAGTVIVAGGTPLLTAAASYDAGNNVDLAVTRVAFGAVAGLTGNQAAVGDGIESVYSTALTGPFATMLGTLFTQNAATYAQSLDQLTGAQYATYLQSLTAVGGRFNGLLSQVGECAATVELRKTCRNEGTARIWGQLNYGRVTKDGDVNAAGYKANDYYIALGTDYDVTPDFVLGLGGAYVKHDLKLDRHNGEIDSDGFQLGAYAVYAPGSYYLKAAVSYTDLSGDASRSISIGSTNGTLLGKPKANIWTLSGELGYNLDLGNSVITPFVGLDYTNAKLKAFTETGVAAAALDVFDSTHNRTATTVGAKWTGQFGSVVPELKLGWRHQFGDEWATVDQAFHAVSNSDFSVVSPFEKKDLAQVGFALNAKVGSSVNLRVGYEGRFNGDFESHSGGVTLIVPFGGR